MLFLEAPAGSFLTPVDLHSGFSYCTKGGVRQETCHWNDLTQAEAYGHTLKAFFKAYPEYTANDFYLAGESYAGQYVPNIATRLLKALPEINLKGIAVGNGCWGGDAHSVECNGPNADQNLEAMYFGKGLISSKLHASIQKACGYDNDNDSGGGGGGGGGVGGGRNGASCDKLLNDMDAAVGPHNVYNVYDNCPNLDLDKWVEMSGKSRRWLHQYMARNMVNPKAYDELNAMAGYFSHGKKNTTTAAEANRANGEVEVEVEAGNPVSGGGFDWTCGQFDALPVYFRRPEVRKALNLPASNANGSTFDYSSSGPASVTLYPALIKQIRVLIYNGDSDTCVPYVGNEEWTTYVCCVCVIIEKVTVRIMYM